MTKGFEHSPLADVNLIRDILRDRYHNGFPVLKELIQNADDAGATELDIGWCRGLSQADHPLLHGPAVFVVNNGKFTNKDARSIRQMGLSNRAAERASIGKFGLGLKSIFHLCEAFFYLASDQPQAPDQVSRFPRNNVLNPWSGDSEAPIHAEWDTLTEASRQLMIDHLRPVLTNDPWFCLWIPLRQEAHGGGFEPIIRYFPGDQEDSQAFLAGVDLPSEISNVLPMLGHLKAIRLWESIDGRLPTEATLDSRSPAKAAAGRQRMVWRLADIRLAVKSQ